MEPKEYLKTIEQLKKLWRKKQYKKIYRILSSLIDAGALTARCLIMKATLLSITDEVPGDLYEIKELYETAVKIEPTSLNALMELAHFENAVYDKPLAAKKICEKLIMVANGYEREARKLIRQCNAQLKSPNGNRNIARKK